MSLVDEHCGSPVAVAQMNLRHANILKVIENMYVEVTYANSRDIRLGLDWRTCPASSTIVKIPFLRRNVEVGTVVADFTPTNNVSIWVVLVHVE